MTSKFKSNHQIGCAMRRFKPFGYGSPSPVEKHLQLITATLGKNRSVIMRFPVSKAKQNLSQLDSDFN